MSTHYDTLGVAQAARPSVIKAAYKALALEYHPDKIFGMSEWDRQCYTEKFRAIKDAYDILSDETLKGDYDRKLAYTNVKTKPAPASNKPEKTASYRRPGYVVMTSPEAREALKNKDSLQLEQIQKDRLKRNREEAFLDEASLLHTASLWQSLASEQANQSLQAYCQLKVAEFEQKLNEWEKYRQQ